MNLRNCRKCDKLFSSITNTEICPACQESEEQEFERVRDFIKSHAGVSVEDVANATGVKVEKILKYLRDGRLMSGSSISFSDAYKLTCYACGTPIPGGRLCERCAQQFSKEVKSSLEHKQKDSSRDSGSRMRSR